MKFTNLEIENFLAIKEAKVRLDGRGLVLIQGENLDDTSQDSNGAGKSSLADALSWALYGVTARGESGNDVINNRVKRGGAKVCLDIDDAGTGYRIERTRLKGKGTLDVYRRDKSALVSLTKGTMKLSQDLIDKIIGCSADVFANAIYSGQERTPDLPGMTDKMLKLLIEEAAGINRLERSYKIARERMNDRSKELAARESVLENNQGMVIVRANSVERLERSQKEWAVANKEEATTLVDATRTAQKTATKAIAAFEALSKEKPELEEKLALVSARLSDVGRYQTAANDAQRNANSITSELRMKTADMKRAAEAINRLKSERDGVNDIVGSDCRSCGKAYTEEDIVDRKLILAAELTDTRNHYRALRVEYQGIDEKLSVALSAVKTAASAIPDTTTELKSRDEIVRSLRAIKDGESDAKNAATRVRELLEQVKRAKARVNPNDKLLTHEQGELEKAQAEVKKSQVLVQKIEDDLLIKRAACQVFGPAGVRAHILDTVTPFLNDRTNHYLSTLTDGNISALWSTIDTNTKGEIKEKFAIAVQSKVGAKTFKGLSGGEKRKVRLSCSMALQDLVSSRATKPIEIYVADEIDHALDEAGLERLMSILEEKASDRGTVLVISHQPLSDWISSFVTVIKKDGVSTLEGKALS
jgi:DNA repair exonuclease SbcCD ATPase subunit